jgi:hypothetical protein
MSSTVIWGRAAVATLLTVALGVLAHEVGGGMAPNLATTVVAAAILLPFGYLLLRRERGLGTIAIALCGAEVGLHAGFALAAPDHGSVLTMLLCGHGSVAVPNGMFLNRGATAGLHLTGLHLSGTPMIVTHLVATLLLAWWVRIGEQVCYAFVRARVARWLPLRWAAAPIAGPRRTPTYAARWTPTPASVPGQVGRRGPPRVLAPATLSYC